MRRGGLVNRNDRALLKAIMEALEQLTLENRTRAESQARQRATATRPPAATTTGWAKTGLLTQAIGAVTIVISIVSLLISTHQFNEQQNTTEEGLNLQDQTVLAGYIDDMSTLMLQDNLLKSTPGAPVRATAIARTAIAVQNADQALKGTFIRYLWGAGLLTGPQPIMDLHQISLDGVSLVYANLYRVALSQVGLTDANFAEANLLGAYLQGSVLIQANLTGPIWLATNETSVPACPVPT